MPNTNIEPEKLLVVTTRLRDYGQLDFPWNSEVDARIDELSVALSAHTSEGDWVFGGGEPTLRPDFPRLLDLLPDGAWVATDGLALHKADIVKKLVDFGLRRVQIPIHSARADAHNWLVGIPGAHRRVCDAIQVLTEHGVEIQVEATLTRPTTPYLEETVAFLYRKGVRRVRFRMLERRGAATDAYITLAPRFGLMEPALESALQVALRHDMEISLRGLPHCAAPHFEDLHIPKATLVVPSGIDVPTPLTPSRGSCDCRSEKCEGAPVAYTDLFGWTEFGTTRGPPHPDNHAIQKPESGIDVPAPPPRAHRTPATRVQDAVTQSMRYDLDGDPMMGLPTQSPPHTIAIRFPADEDTRSIKKRLVEASQQGADTLQIIGDTRHPQILALLREAQRLSFPRIIFSGDITGLSQHSPKSLFHLRGIKVIQFQADIENLEVAQRIQTAASVDIQAFVTLNDKCTPSGIEECWATNEWPGAPCFAIGPDSDRKALRDEASKLPPSPTKEALLFALDGNQAPLFGAPGSTATETPDGLSWPNPSPFTVE